MQMIGLVLFESDGSDRPSFIYSEVLRMIP